ncbi:MAG: ATP-binding protein [Cyanobium sp.]
MRTQRTRAHTAALVCRSPHAAWAHQGFSLAEVGQEAAATLWLRGGFPRSFLAARDSDSLLWRRDFIRTLLESDLPQLGVRVPAVSLQRFWAMLAHFHGQVWNGSELGRSLGVNQTTCRRYLDLLTGVFMVWLLQPWHAILLKRQVKAPKLYFRDSGLLHQLLQIPKPGCPAATLAAGGLDVTGPCGS